MKEKTLFDYAKQIMMHDTTNIPENTTYALLRWFSGEQHNLKQCSKINKYFFHVKPKMLLSLMANSSFLILPKYPKGIKTDNKKYDAIKDYLCDVYKIGNSELKKSKTTIQQLINNPLFINSINSRSGMSWDDLKTFGVKKKTFKPKKIIVEKKLNKWF